MSAEQPYAKDRYFVAVKVLLRNGNKLLIIHDTFGEWDVPGGRLQADEFETSLEDVVARKMREELGSAARYQLGQAKVFFRHQRQEQGLGGQTVRIFAVGYEAQYLGGKLVLCDYLDKMEWVDIKSFVPKDYFVGGWLKGIQQYLALVN